MGGHLTLEHLQTCSPWVNRFELLLETNYKLNNTSSSPISQEQNTMVARSRVGGRSTKRDSDRRKTNPYRPATSQQQEVPAGTVTAERAIAEYLALGVLRRMSQPETQLTWHWAPVFGRRKVDSGKIRMITHLRQLNSAWAQPPKFKTDNWQTVGECPSLNPHLTWGAVVDLSNFFFHLGLHPSARRWI